MTINVSNEIPCCENCPDVKCHYNPQSGWSEKSVDDDMREMWRHTNQKGCLSHPRAREYLNKDVIEELKRRSGQAEVIPGRGLYIMGCVEAIELMKKGVGK